MTVDPVINQRRRRLSVAGETPVREASDLLRVGQSQLAAGEAAAFTITSDKTPESQRVQQ
jgi:hypothetical protein